MDTLLKVLIFGGTTFLGPHLVEELQKKGHEITLFNRGTQKNDLPNVEQLHGDRNGNLEALKGRNWDVVIDTSGNIPRHVKTSCELLADSVRSYVYISSISAYRDFHRQNIDESYPLSKLDNENIEEINDQTYGGLKAACEKVVMHYFPDNSLIIRPGFIVGPLDPTDRFTFWPVRVNKGGEIVAPGSPEQLLQFIDARDLAKWIVTMVEKEAAGIYNATGPEKPITFEQFLQICQQVSKKTSSLVWISEEILLDNGVEDGVELPLWFSSKRNVPGFMNVSIQKALQAGLTFRPLSETIMDTLQWNINRSSKKTKIGLSPVKEQKLLELRK